ncbi:MAG: catechol-2,3-dioxygenase [Chloroflexota bacterium]|nr:MAG: catechol-2,3-dioxygenase [Chloroflexota bacterium]
MKTVKMDPAMRCGAVRLVVRDLDRSLRYYQERIGLRLLRREDGAAALGADQDVLLTLVEQPDALPVQRGRTGLYHFALLTPDRVALSRVLNHLLATQTPIDGASDHGVSEALYLSDPDGHGIEIYRDRPRREWPFVKGSLGMTTDPLDVRGLVAADRTRAPWEGIDPHTVMGHVHLHVADLAAAEHFYVDLLGLDLMQRFGGQAAFVSAGGYHHHLGLNTWAGIGAPPPPPTAARLLDFQLVVPNSMILTEIVDGLRISGIEVNATDEGWSVLDPSGNRILLNHLN